MPNNMSPFNGDYIGSDGKVHNLLELGPAPPDSPKRRMSPMSGRFFASDGSVHHIEELLGSGGNPPSDMNFAYPVGSVFTSVSSANPGIQLGGTWEPLNTDYDIFITPNKSNPQQFIPFYMWRRIA